MTDRAALFANVLNDPADDTARLVLADWLEENGEVAFGQFLRAGVITSRARFVEYVEDQDYFAALPALAAFARSGTPARWLVALGLGPQPLAPRDWAWDNMFDRVTLRVGAHVGIFERGLLAEFELTLDRWYSIAETAIAAWPIEEVRISDVPGLTFAIALVEAGWQLTGRVRLPRRTVPLTGLSIPASFAPSAVLAEANAEWAADHTFTDRTALVEGIEKESRAIVADLQEVIAERWPQSPRLRR